jgi:hypothetical protein
MASGPAKLPRFVQPRGAPPPVNTPQRRVTPIFPLGRPISWPSGRTGYGSRVATRDCIQPITMRLQAR